MIYTLRLFYTWLLPPGLFLVTFLISLLLFTKTKKKSWLVFPCLLLYLLSISAVSDQLVKPLEDYYPQPALNELKNAQAIVVLGGGACDGVPDFDGEGQIANAAANRFLMGLRLHRALQLPIILSGGQGYSRTATEAEIAARTLKACGVEEKNLIIEGRSRNTLQNATFTKRICQQQGLQKLILVTSASHLPRSVLLFQRESIDIIPYPADYQTYKKVELNVFSFIPQQQSLRNSTIAMKEYLGIFAIKANFQ